MKEFRRYAWRRKTHTTKSSKFSKHGASALFTREHFPESDGRKGWDGGTWYVYMSCILSESETERTLEREPVPERALVRDRSISYLPIKGRRFVQFILNHGTVTGCQ